MNITYDLIEPLLADSEVDGSEIICAFEVPGTGEVIESSARIKRSNSLQSNVTRQVTRMGSNMLRREASKLVRRALGGGMLGRLGSATVRSASRPMATGSQFTAEDREDAIVDAFKKVASHFYYDETQGVWTAPPAAGTSRRQPEKSATAAPKSPVEEQLQKAPLSSRFEREVLARILVELASADGEIEAEEQEFLESIVGREFGAVHDLAAMEPVSPVECEELNSGARETVYMLAWVMTLIDMDVSPQERNILLEYAGMFGLSNQKMDEIVLKAKRYLLESSISVDTSRDELFELADRLSLDRTEAERALIQLKKRM